MWVYWNWRWICEQTFERLITITSNGFEMKRTMKRKKKPNPRWNTMAEKSPEWYFQFVYVCPGCLSFDICLVLGNIIRIFFHMNSNNFEFQSETREKWRNLLHMTLLFRWHLSGAPHRFWPPSPPLPLPLSPVRNERWPLFYAICNCAHTFCSHFFFYYH